MDKQEFIDCKVRISKKKKKKIETEAPDAKTAESRKPEVKGFLIAIKRKKFDFMLKLRSYVRWEPQVTCS